MRNDRRRLPEIWETWLPNPYNYTYIYFGPYESHEVARVVADRECARLGGTGSGANYYPDGKLNRGPGWYADVTIRNPQR